MPHVLRRRRGHCVGLSSIYLALGYRAGLPLFGVSAPRHFFVRWDGEGLRQNVELTARGAPHPDSYYVERYRISEDAINRGVHLQSLQRREMLVEILNNRASYHWDRGDVARASRDLDRVVVASHNFARAYAGRGFIALQRGELKEARDDLGRALEIDPGYARAHLLLGQVHLRGGWLSRAEASFERAIALDSQSALAVTYLGRCFAARGEPDRALACHERAVRSDPKCEAAWNNLGRVHTSLGGRDEARAAFKEALALGPDSLTARANLVLLEKHAGRLSVRGRLAFRGVCKAYESALMQAPQNDQLRARYVHFLLGAEQGLQRALPLALELGRRSPTPHTLATLARVQLALGQRAHALESVERAIELDGARGGTERARLVGLQREIEAI
jgi:tetratricopeptide (TPR) repeat protein